MAWYVSIEPLVASRTSGSNTLGPREDLQPGPVKTAAKGYGFFPFENLADYPRLEAVHGDLYILHLSARRKEASAEERELYITIPRRIVDKAGPRKTRLIVEDKGATFVLGSVRRFEPWLPSEP